MLIGELNIPKEESDVVVIGAGAAGLTAAIAAAEANAKTIILEKAPDLSNSNTTRGGGAFLIAPEREVYADAPRLSVKEKVAEAIRASGGLVDPELIRRGVESIDDTLDWLKKHGVRYTDRPFINLPQSYGVIPLGLGPGLSKQLLSIAQRMGCRVFFKTRAQELLTNTKGKVVGVRAMTTKGLKDFMAKAVVLATAGFQANQEMLMRYFGAEFVYGVKLTGSPYSTGDGHLMAEKIGAKLINMDQFHSRNIGKDWSPGTTGVPGPVRVLHSIIHYCIFVNKFGKRFMDEVDTSNIIANTIAKQTGEEIAIIFDEKIKAIRPDEVDGYKPPGIVMKFPAIEALAEAIEVPLEEFKKTIMGFNHAVKDNKALNLNVPKRDCAMKIENPPFYAIYPVWSGLNCTLGGVKITPDAQVVDRDDVPIPGLYAAGEIAAGFFAGRFYTTKCGATYYKGNYQVTTAAIAYCHIFGRIAGLNAAKISA